MKTAKTASAGLFLVMLLWGFIPLGAQTIDDNITITASSSTRIAKERASYIMINSRYPLVPGDTFQLEYAQRGDKVNLPFFVEEDYTVNLTYMGNLNVKGMTLADLKIKVAELVENSFPGSYSQLVITSPGIFMIPVRGEVKAAVEIPAWGFMKLSEAIEKVVTSYSSSRRVEILSKEGESRFYDLYTALRYGNKGDDPFLRVGDTIILHKYDRRVNISGQVRRPGWYELIEGDDLTTLLQEMGDDFTPAADLSRVAINRSISENSEYGETIYLDLSEAIPEDFTLNNLDSVSIPVKAVFQPKIYFQGAIGRSEVGTTVSNKFPLTITPGEKLSSVLLRVQGQFNLGSDLTKAVLSRVGEPGSRGINLEELLLNPDSEYDIVLSDQDMIVIPFRQYQIYVGGQVNNPGAFPYIPNRTWEYYIGLAGGFNIDSHIGTKVRISDVYGEKHKQEDRFIQPEDVIVAPANHPLYWIGEYGTEIILIASSITSTVVLINWIAEVIGNSPELVPIPDDGTTTTTE